MIKQRISIGVCLHNGIRCDRASRAALVLYDDLLAKDAAERLRRDPRRHIDSAAGRKRNNQLDRP